MHKPFQIHPDGIYDDGTLVLNLGVSSSTLLQARRTGRLRFSRKGKRILYLGRWILEWLEAEPLSANEGGGT